jgi:hypothetical protein
LLELEELENEGNIYRPRHNCYKPTTKWFYENQMWFV